MVRLAHAKGIVAATRLQVGTYGERIVVLRKRADREPSRRA